MLARAARRRAAFRYIAAEHSQALRLPWLCPALSRSRKDTRPTTTISSRPPGRRKIPPSGTTTSTRHLASAADSTESFLPSLDAYVPFPSSAYGDAPSRTRDFDFGNNAAEWISPFQQSGVDDIIAIDSTIAQPPPREASGRRIGVEIHGDAHDIEVTLHACLQLYQWNRAFALLRQLEHVYEWNSYSAQNLLEAYNRTLEAMVVDLVKNRNKTNIDRINRWVEVDMKRAGIQPNAHTYALKIKVALATMGSDSKRDRTVRRYWEFAKNRDTGPDVIALREILTDSDLGKLSQICPEMMFGSTVQQKSSMNVETKSPEQDSLKILETGQKGLGLSSLRESLSSFMNKEDALNQSTEEDINLLESDNPSVARQLRVETDALQSAIKRWRAEHEKMAKLGLASGAFRGKLSNVLWQWHTTMAQKIVKELEKVEKAEAKTKKTTEEKLRAEYGPFLRLLTPEHYSALVTINIIQIMSKAGIGTPIKVGRTVCELGRIVEIEVESEQALKAQRAQKAQGESEPKHYKWKDPQLKQTIDITTSWGESMEHFKSRLYSKKVRWSAAIHARVGAVLCEMLFDSAKVLVQQENSTTGEAESVYKSAFVKEIAFSKGKQVGVISLHPRMIEMMTKEPPSHLIAKQLPMVSRPRPWTGFYEGGYLSSNTPFLRSKTSDMSQRDYGEAAASRGDLDQIFAGIDVLGGTGWKINKNVFQVMLNAWNSGEAIANLPPSGMTFPEVSKPAPDADARTRFMYYESLRAQENEKSGMHSNRCFQSFQMEIAKAYLNETFYLPHNVDFRGRAYPIPPYLNQMGADNCRGLLKFAKGRSLGESGLRWLQIHLSNVYGYDKASLSDRANFPMEHFDDILDSVRNPLGGKRWWLTAEDPWQCLAACFELTAALEHPNPAEFVSHLAVHQDGSCNGLQHYAALGGDMQGARQVNLEPGDKPADVYTGIAELVKAEIKADAEAGHELGIYLDGKIVRKIVKQTVMTNVYGVTFLGAVRQVREQIDDMLPELKKQRRSGAAGTYIARKIFKALGTMFSGAHDIQYWLGDCANRISSSLSPAQLQLIMERNKKGLYFNDASGDGRKNPQSERAAKKKHLDPSLFRSSVIWTTPLKLPVVQPYRIIKGRRIKTNLQTVVLHEPTIADAVDKRKQLQAFPPNFVHSLDATHMILSALQADKMGLDFSAVHDSFWTHAADVDTMNELLRDAFIRMHSEDIIGRLAAEFERRYRGYMYLATVRSKSPLAAKLKTFRAEQKYSYGRSQEAKRYQELLLEIERQELLNSEDPEQVAKGQDMVTPASIFAKHNGEQHLFSRDSLGQTAHGHVLAETSDAVLERALESEEVKDDHNIDLSATLEPLIENNAMVGSDASVIADTIEEAGQAMVDIDSKQPQKKRKKEVKEAKIHVWLPLTFREVPKKGDFDVTRLKNSKYFFS